MTFFYHRASRVPARITIVFLMFIGTFLPEGVRSEIRYVDPFLGNNTYSGTTWGQSYKTLKKALEEVATNSAITEIRLTEGTYYPTGDQTVTDRGQSFLITRGNVTIRGGYPIGGGTASNPDQYVTRLSGNIGDITSHDDNAYHVMVIRNVTSGQVLVEGLTIERGYGNSTSSTGDVYHNFGAGVSVINNSSPSEIRFNKVNFEHNRTSERSAAGAVYVRSSTVLFGSCLLRANSAEVQGGAMDVRYSVVRMYNSQISGNVALISPAIIGHDSQIELNGCTIAGNRATVSSTGQGTIDLSNTTLKVYNTILAGNNKGIAPNESSVLESKNSLIQGQTSQDNGSINGNDVSPWFLNPANPSDAPTTNGDYRLSYASPCLDKGNNALLASGFYTDVTGAERIWKGRVDMGAYEFVANCYTTELYVDASRSGPSTGFNWGSAYPTLSDALYVAQYCGNVTTIHVAAGTYYPAGSASETKRDTSFVIKKGGLKILGGYPTGGGERNLSSNPTVLSGDIGTSGTFTDNVFHVLAIAGLAANADSVILDGLTITGGNASEASTSTYNGQSFNNEHGGGIYLLGNNGNNKITLRNLTVTNNRASRGGGIYVDASSNPHLSQSKIISNYAGFNAGGINNQSPSATFTNLSISGNEAASSGGGVFNAFSGSMFINCLFSGNKASSGGGIVNYRSATTFVNCTVAGNRAGSTGGGMIEDPGYHTNIYNCIIVGNSALDNSGMWFNNSSIPVVKNSLVQDLTGDDENGNVSHQGGAGFVAPADHSSAPTTAGNYRLSILSPVLNKGNNNWLGSYTGTDLDGQNRFNGTAVDLGAYEWNCPTGIATLHVDGTATAGGDGKTWESAIKTLSEALIMADKCGDVSEIRVAAGIYEPVRTGSSGRDATFAITRPGLKLLGGYPIGGGSRNPVENNTILAAQIGGAQENSVYHVVAIAGLLATGDSVIVDGLTIVGGYADGSGSTWLNDVELKRDNGAGIIIVGNENGKKLVVRNCLFAANTAKAYGGGASVQNSSPLITNCKFFDNSGKDGGGMHNESASPTIINTQFKGNTSLGNGGGLLNVSSSPEITGCLFSGNLAGLGGGIYNYTSSPVITNCTISGNKVVSGHGGNIYNTASSYPFLHNSILHGNQSGLFHSGSATTITYSLVEGMTETSNGNLNGNTTQPQFEEPLSWELAPTSEGDYRLKSGSPAIDQGNVHYLPQNFKLDAGGNLRVTGELVDMGAYESLVASVCPSGTILYVDANAATPGDGSAWATPLTVLDKALQKANACPGITEIRVAKGTYYPTGLKSIKNRSASFLIKRDGIRLSGGYATGGAIRDISANPTILSGNIGDDAIGDDNSYHVMQIFGIEISDPIIAEGFTITGGKANGPENVYYGNIQASERFGGGIYIHSNTGNEYVSLQSNRFVSNHADIQGGGLSVIGVNLRIEQCVISQNSSNSYGGGLSIDGKSASIQKSSFSGNIASQQGGAVTISGTQFSAFNSTFTGNKAGDLSGAIGGALGRIRLENCTISGNSSSYNAAIDVLWGEGISVFNSIIDGNSSGIGGTANWTNSEVSITIEGSIVQGRTGYENGNLPSGLSALFEQSPSHATAPFTEGNYHLAAGSRAINTGRNSRVSNEQTKDMDGNDRIRNFRVDMGAYEYDCDLTLTPDESSFKARVEGGVNYLMDACHLVAIIEPTGTSPVSGDLTVSAWLKANLISHDAARFVRRHYNLNPENAAGAATASVKLYFTPEDFEHYNTEFGSSDGHLLPVLPTDDVSKLRVYQYHGAGDEEGLPSGYEVLPVVLMPTVSWKADLDLWEVSFNVTGFSGFFISAQTQNPLPVTLVSFEGQKQEQSIALTWQTSAEINTSYFELQRSEDARKFQAIGKVQAQGPSSYSFQDKAQGSCSIRYYRLKMVDHDGSFEYSRLVAIQPDCGEQRFHLYPNPIEANGPFTLRPEKEFTGEITVKVTGTEGRMFMEKTASLHSATPKVIIPTKGWVPGVYMIIIESKESREIHKIIVR